MKPIRYALLAALPVLGMAASLTSGPSTQDSIPEVFYSSVADRQAPIWISADHARTSANQIQWKLFAPDERESLRHKLAAQERLKATEPIRGLSALQISGREPVGDDNCVTYEQAFLHLSGQIERPGLEGLLKSARGVYSASIEGFSQGFLLGSPASVLELRVNEVLKSEGGPVPVQELFAVYPFARFAIGQDVFCSGVPGKIPQPKIGQQVIVFVTSEPLDRQKTLVWADPEYFIAEEEGGAVSLPRALEGDPDLFPVQSFREAEELLRRALQRLRGRPQSSIGGRESRR